MAVSQEVKTQNVVLKDLTPGVRRDPRRAPPAATSRPIGFLTPKDNKNKPQAKAAKRP